MREQVFKGSSPDGRWVITVDCALDEAGEPTDWSAVVVLDGQNIIDALKTDDSDKLVRWTHRQMTEVMRRTNVETPNGTPEEAEDTVGDT